MLDRHGFFPHRNEENYRRIKKEEYETRGTYIILEELLQKPGSLEILSEYVDLDQTKCEEIIKKSEDWQVKVVAVEVGISSKTAKTLIKNSHDHFVNRKLVEKIKDLKFLKQLMIEYLKVEAYPDRIIEQSTFHKLVARIDDQNELGDIAIWSSGDDPKSWRTASEILEKITDITILKRLMKDAVDIDVRRAAGAKLSDDRIEEDWNQLMWNAYNKK